MAQLSKVAVVGGGIGGLTAALALLRARIDVDVYEQAPEFQEVGAGVQISSNGTCVLHALGLQEAIERVGSVPKAKEIRLWSTGQTWKLFDLGAVSVELYGFPYVFMHRRDLHGMLLEGIRRLKPDALHLGMRCVGVAQSETGVTLRFHTGEMAQAALAIGPTAFIRSCARACSAPPRRNLPAASPGAASRRWSGCRRRFRAPAARTGSGPAATWCTIPCDAANS
jgi:2-polyprenyl-6-methoxyphenol hydroxylase-like FAD-dependent oxidoreductase